MNYYYCGAVVCIFLETGHYRGRTTETGGSENEPFS